MISRNDNFIRLKDGTLYLSKRQGLVADEELLLNIILLISRTYLKILKLDLLSLSIAIADQLIRVLENSNCL